MAERSSLNINTINLNEKGKPIGREMWEKLGHDHFNREAHHEEHHGAGHGAHAEAHGKHASMAEIIADCSAVICGGMGMVAYESMQRLNIKPIVTDLRDIDAAIQAYIDGELIDHIELLH